MNKKPNVTVNPTVNGTADTAASDALAELMNQQQGNGTNPDPLDEEDEENDNTPITSSFKDIVRDLLADSSCHKVTGIVKNITCTEQEGINGPWTRVTFTLRNKIKGYNPQEDGTYELGLTNLVYNSLFAIVGAMRENDELSWLGNSILENPQALNPILNGATLTIIQHELSQGEIYENPFSSNPTPVDIQHDSIFNYVVAFKLSPVGKKFIDKVADVMATKMLNI